jgi:hypothetical protein
MFFILSNRVSPVLGLDDLVSVVLQHLAGAQTHERCIVDDHYLCHYQFSSTEIVVGVAQTARAAGRSSIIG